MSRFDLYGLFWNDEDLKKKGGPIRSMPKIKSKWKPTPPSEWPNFKHAKRIALDTETYDPNLRTQGAGYARGDGHIVGVSAAVDRKNSIYLPMRHEVQSELNQDPDRVLMWCKDNLSGRQVKIGANIQYDIGWLRAEGVEIPGPYIDVLHAEALIDENQFKFDLESAAQKYLGVGKKSKKLYKWLARYYGGKIDDKQRANMYRAPPALVGPYAEADAWEPFEIWKVQKKILKQENLMGVFDIEERLIPMLLDMKFRGVQIDVPYTENLRDELREKELNVRSKLRDVAGVAVDVYSSRSIEKAFKREGLSYPKTAKGNPSFTKMFLNAHEHPMAQLIVKVRELDKLRVTFVENALLNNHIKGRVFCDFRQLKGSTGGTESGRLSSANPNLQQIPVRSEMGRRVRRCFIPDSGFTHWYRGDSNQVEYRFLAHYAVGPGSDKMRKLYKKDPNTDYHLATTTLIDAITNILLDRKHTKNINFGLTYGMGQGKLKRQLGVDSRVGDQLFAAYHEGVPFVKSTFEHYMNIAATVGYITTVLGRRSRFETYEQAWGEEMVKGYTRALRRWGPGQFQRAMTHKALNRLLQGSAADHLKKGMVDTYESGVYDEMGVPSLNVHDELDGSCIPSEHTEALLELKRIMENCLKLRIPLIFDFEIGKNWGELEAI